MGGIEPLTFKIRKVVVPPELIVSNIYIYLINIVLETQNNFIYSHRKSTSYWISKFTQVILILCIIQCPLHRE